jgi:hypothetical protein
MQTRREMLGGLGTAGISVPQTVLLRADQVI